MTEMEQKQLAFIHQAVAKMNLSADEYVDTQDGLIHCKNCRKPRLVLLTAMPGRPFALVANVPVSKRNWKENCRKKNASKKNFVSLIEEN